VTSIVSFENVSKHYRLGRERSNVRSLIPGSSVSWDRPGNYVALDNIDFEVERGGSIGIIGPNGAGKSTILKLVAGIVTPTRGNVRVTGSVASLVELGVGFHPDMTGRENLTFGAAVLGMGPRSIRERLDDIVDFADIGAFLDTPIKRYSSGMIARLGFAAATHLDADILVLDEVLAVGDADFQRKCHTRIEEVLKGGTTLVYSSHALWTVHTLCREAIFLNHGTIVARGSSRDVVLEYQRFHRNLEESMPGLSTAATFHNVSVSEHEIEQGGSIHLDIDVELMQALPDAHILVMISNPVSRLSMTTSSLKGGISFGPLGRRALSCTLSEIPLPPGNYELHVILYGDQRVPIVDDLRRFNLRIIGDPVNPEFNSLEVPARWSSAFN
jgi:ABC-type polysaccharide/polyol phosphate transport system ATPase subunit